jgi:hypothetical protein
MRYYKLRDELCKGVHGVSTHLCIIVGDGLSVFAEKYWGAVGDGR